MNYKQNLNNLKKDFVDNRSFTLFVGAGINAGKNIKLLWNDLVKKACEVSFRQIARSLELSPQDTSILLCILGIKKISINDILHLDTFREGVEKSKKTERIERLTSGIEEEIAQFMSLKDYVASHFPIEIQVSIIKTLLGESYIPFIQDNLYTQCNQEVIRKEFKAYQTQFIVHDDYTPGELFSLFVVARMILLNPQIKSVISYNYDNFLTFAVCYLLNHHEYYFTAEEAEFLRLRYQVGQQAELNHIVPAIDIYNGNGIHSQNKGSCNSIPIYHVHGFIPPFEDLQYNDAPEIILSSDEYMSSIGENSSWNISAQLNSILTTDSLFIGSSITDLSTKRMINIAAEQGIKRHRYVLDAYDRDSYPKEKKILRIIKNSYLETLGVKVIDCDEGFGRLFQQIAKIKTLHTK